MRGSHPREDGSTTPGAASYTLHQTLADDRLPNDRVFNRPHSRGRNRSLGWGAATLVPSLEKRFRIALLAFAAGALCSVAASAAERGDDAAVVLRASGTTQDGIGAGTIVAKAGTTVRILTAKHVATFGSLSVRFNDGSRATARLILAFPDRDLAIVEADVPTALAATLRPATIASPQPAAGMHVSGSGVSGPAFEPASLPSSLGVLPDGPARGRYTFACALCHEGDSGGGVFDRAGRLVGIYIGYFGDGPRDRISVAEGPLEAARIARSLPYATTIASSR